MNISIICLPCHREKQWVHINNIWKYVVLHLFPFFSVVFNFKCDMPRHKKITFVPSSRNFFIEKVSQSVELKIWFNLRFVHVRRDLRFHDWMSMCMFTCCLYVCDRLMKQLNVAEFYHLAKHIDKIWVQVLFSSQLNINILLSIYINENWKELFMTFDCMCAHTEAHKLTRTNSIYRSFFITKTTTKMSYEECNSMQFIYCKLIALKEMIW